MSIENKTELVVLNKNKKKKSDYESYRSYIRSILKETHPFIGITNSCLEMINGLIKHLFSKLVSESKNLAKSAKRKTVSKNDLQHALILILGSNDFQKECSDLANKAIETYLFALKNKTESSIPKSDKKTSVSRHSKAGIKFPVGRIDRQTKFNLNGQKRVSGTFPVALATALEFFANCLLDKCVSRLESEGKVKTLTSRHLQGAIEEDQQLNEIFKDCSFRGSNKKNIVQSIVLSNRTIRKRPRTSIDQNSQKKQKK